MTTSSAPAPTKGMTARNVCALLLGVVGCLQMTGHLLGQPWMSGLGAATVVAPFPKVFSAVKDKETFANAYTIRYETADGRSIYKPVSPHYYARLRGHYWRRNVYSAALTNGPVLPRTLWEPVFCSGLAPGGPFREELGVPAGAARVRVELTPRAEDDDTVQTLEPRCAP